MNRFVIPLLSLAVVGGCADRPETIDTSGRHPSVGTTTAMTPEAKEADVDTGRLLVVAPHSGYTVYTEEGHKVAHEDNGGLHGAPVERKLAPGRYFVRLDQASPGREFWVRIEKGRVTRVENRQGNEAPPTVK